MPMYKLIECSNNYSDTSGSLWQFKRDEQNMNNENLLMLQKLATKENYKISQLIILQTLITKILWKFTENA